MSLDLSGVLDELLARRQQSRDMKVATMTVVVFVDDPQTGAWARDRVHALAVKHPSRVVVLDATQPMDVHAVSSECAEHSECVKTRGDWIELGVDAGTPGMLVWAAKELSLPEAPVVLLWVARTLAGDERFAALAPEMRCIVYNSSLLDDRDAALRELVAFVDARPDLPIADLAYLRLAPWQESVALFFDAKNVVHELFDLRRVEIVCGSDPEAYYLLGWLASRLGWTPCGAGEFCNRFGATIEFSIARGGLPRRLSSVTLASSRTTFIAQADAQWQAVGLTLRGEHQHPARCHPIGHIDVATLVERAILSGATDRIFRDSLRLAGQILALRKD